MIAFLLAAALAAPPAPAKAAEAKHGMVVAVCPLAADVGAAALKAGGTAVDAAVAVAFAEAVTWPEAGNIGGGGFMLVRAADGTATVFDYRETAPAAATENLFADGTVTWRSHKSAGVPGTVRGLAAAHKKFGKLPWKDLLAPAVKLAGGFTVDAPLAGRLNGIFADGKLTNAEFNRVYGREKWAAGDTLALPDLAKTLAGIAEHGPDYFYTGPVAEMIEAEMKAGGGLITKADLKSYACIEREPVRGTYRGYGVLGAPPPSSGGVAVVEALNILETFDLAASARQSAATIHLIAEAQRRAFADRAAHLGDPAFSAFPPKLLDKASAKTLAAGIDPKRATKSESLGPKTADEGGGDSTTHFSVVDGAGMAVSNTYTLENSFGSRVVVPGAGFILNNEMTDFNPRPGITTRAGAIGTPANRVAPGKRMLSSMAPTILTKDGKLFLITGSPGGRTIINTVLCVVVNAVDFRMGAQAAVDEPRQHMPWFPDRLTVETKDTEVLNQLRAMGHTVATGKQGDAHTILIDPATGLRHGAADKRLNGKAAGY